jgi:hypothetical protein
MEYSGGANGLFLGGAAVPEMCYQILASVRKSREISNDSQPTSNFVFSEGHK